MPRGKLLVLDDDATVGSLLVFVAESVDFEARLCEAGPAFFQTLITLNSKPPCSRPAASGSIRPACWPSRFRSPP